MQNGSNLIPTDIATCYNADVKFANTESARPLVGHSNVVFLELTERLHNVRKSNRSSPECSRPLSAAQASAGPRRAAGRCGLNPANLFES